MPTISGASGCPTVHATSSRPGADARAPSRSQPRPAIRAAARRATALPAAQRRGVGDELLAVSRGTTSAVDDGGAVSVPSPTSRPRNLAERARRATRLPPRTVPAARPRARRPRTGRSPASSFVQVATGAGIRRDVGRLRGEPDVVARRDPEFGDRGRGHVDEHRVRALSRSPGCGRRAAPGPSPSRPTRCGHCSRAGSFGVHRERRRPYRHEHRAVRRVGRDDRAAAGKTHPPVDGRAGIQVHAHQPRDVGRRGPAS